MWRGGSQNNGYPLKWADLALGVWLSLVSLVPLQVSVIKLQRLDNKIRFLPSGNSLWNELGYPLVTESRFFLLVMLLIHLGLNTLWLVLYYDKAASAIFLSRVIKNLLCFPMEVGLFLAVYKAVGKQVIKGLV